jgi:hypothetical protein
LRWINVAYGFGQILYTHPTNLGQPARQDKFSNPEGDWLMKNHTTDETIYPYAIIGSLTARCGRVTLVTGGATVAGLGLARVGDVVTWRRGDVVRW